MINLIIWIIMLSHTLLYDIPLQYDYFHQHWDRKTEFDFPLCHFLCKMQNGIEIVDKRLLFSITRITPKNTPQLYSFSIDQDDNFQYLPFFSDFGPLSILQIHRFYVLVNNILETHKEKCQYYTNCYPANIANACLLVATYRMIALKMSVEESVKPIEHLLPTLKPYRDASSFPSTYNLTVISCLRGLEKAMQLGWYDPSTFDAEDWAKYEQVENGDMNWLIPGKLLAFASPYSTGIVRGGWRVCTPKDIIPVFQAKGITHVVRLCQKFYEESDFTKAGIKHTELYFLDGSTPPKEVLERWLRMAAGPDVIALHCKAGLGRTGTLAACHMVQACGFDGHAAIGWIRLCRPGSVIGPQQRFVTRFGEILAAQSPPPAETAEPVHTPTKTLRAALGVAEEKRKTARGEAADDSEVVPKVPQPRKYNRPKVPQTPKK